MPGTNYADTVEQAAKSYQFAMMSGLGETEGIPDGFVYEPPPEAFTEDGTLIWGEMDPSFPEFEGKREFYSIEWYKITTSDKLHKKGFKVPEAAYKTDRWGLYDQFARSLGEGVSIQQRRDFFALLMAGTGGTKGLAYDGQFFFDTDHTAKDENGAAITYSNLHASTVFSAANFETVRTAKRTRRLNNGEFVSNRSDRRFHVVVGPSNEGAARDAFDLPKDGANQTFNAATWEVWPELSGSHAGKWLVGERHPQAPAAAPVLMRISQQPRMISRTDIAGDPMFYEGMLEWGVDAGWWLGYGRHEFWDLCTP